MFSQNEKVAGLLLVVGGILYLWLDGVGVHYSNVDLVNVGLVLLGVLMIAGTYFIQVAFKSALFTILIVLAAIGTIVIGVVPYVGYGDSLYYPFAYLGYAFFALSAIMSYKFEKSPLKYVSIMLGVLSLLGLALWVSGVEIAGIKASPTVIDYLILPWLITFGAYLTHE